MSLIEYNVSKDQIDKGIAQLNAVSPKYDYKTHSILGMAANTNIPLGILAAIFDIATVGVFEIIRVVYVNYNNNSYQQLCDDFAKRQLEINDRKESKEATGSIFRKSVRELEKQNREVFTQLQRRVTKAGEAPTADADAIRIAAQYKIERAICAANGLANEEDHDDVIDAAAKEASDKLIINTEDSEMRSGVAGFISNGLGSIDAEAIKDLASESGKSKEEVEKEIGKQLRGRYPKDREFEKATRPKPAEFRKQVENDKKNATAKMKTEVAARFKAIGELYKLDKENENLQEQYQDILADLGQEESIEDGAATGYYLQRDAAQKTLDNDKIRGRKKTQAENSKKEADEKIQELEKKKADVENKVIVMGANEKKAKAALKKAEGNYFKLINTHFGIAVARDGTVTSARIRDDKAVEAIVTAGTRNEDEETEEGKLKKRELPDVSKHFNKALKLKEAEDAHDPKVRKIARLRQAEINRRAAEKARVKSPELPGDKKLELDYFADAVGSKLSKANEKLLKRINKLEDRRDEKTRGSSSSDEEVAGSERSNPEEDEGGERRISLDADRRDDHAADNVDGDDNAADDVDGDDNVDAPKADAPKADAPKSRRAGLSKWVAKLKVAPDANADDNVDNN